jgi:hypothetical protein
MGLRSVATAFGLVGGLCWLLYAFSDQEVLGWAGFAMLGIAATAAGATLVSGVPALRVFVAVAFPVLLWSVVEVAHDAGTDRSVDGLFGAAAVVAAAAAFLTRPVHGNH